MSDEYMDDDYHGKKRRRWPFLLLGFFIGFITVPAILAIVIASFISRPVGKTVNTIDRFANAGLYETLFGSDDDLGILDERYSGMKLKDAIGDISNIAGKGNQLTFADLNSISPQVEKTVDNLIDTAKEKNIFLEKETLMTTPLADLSTVLTDEVKEIELGMVLLATKPEMFDDENSGDILKNLFFGKENINYVEVNGTPEMLPITYGFTNNTFVCVDETLYEKDGNVWKSEDGDYIRSVENNYALYTSEGEFVYELRLDNARSAVNYVAYAENADGVVAPVKQSSLALGAFMGDNTDPISVIGKLDLGVLLGVNVEANATHEDNKMIVAISYGTYGVDYTFENGKVVPLNGNTFTTLNDLMDEPDEILNDVQLGSLLGIDTREDAEDKDNAMLVALAYGTYGIDFEYDENGTIIPKNGKEFTSLGELLTNPNDTLRDIQVGPLLGITTKEDVEANDSLLVSLSYGVYGEDFTYDEHGKITQIPGGKAFTTVEQLMDSKQSEEILKSVPLSSVFNVDIFDEKSDPLTLSLVYGTKGKHYNIVEKDGKKFIDWQINPETNEPYKERTFGDLRSGDMSEIINDLRICDVLTVEEGETGLVATLANKKDEKGNPWTIAHLTDENIKQLTLGEVMEIDESSHPLLIHMQNTTIEGLDNDYIDGITVQDALGITETDDPILLQIIDMKLGDLKDSSKLKERINNLKVSDLVEDAGNNFYLKHVLNSSIGELPNDINNLTVIQLFSDIIEFKNGEVTGTWYYLLTYNPDDPTSYPYTAPEDYKVTDMDKLIENMHNNIESSTLRKMHDDGLVPHIEEDTLNYGLVYEVGAIDLESHIRDILGLEAGDPIPEELEIGDLTVIQISKYLTVLLKAINGEL